MSTPDSSSPPSRRERRIGMRLESRRDRPLYECLLQLRGTTLTERLRLGHIYAVGGEGAIFELHDTGDPAARLLAKIALVPWHKPVRLTSRMLRARREVIEHEADLLLTAGSPYMPTCFGTEHFDNPLLEAARGGEFGKPEPVLVMQRLGGQDLDVWLCRVHRGGLDPASLRPTFDRLVVGVLQALTDLENRGFLYADLRPGNLRVVGRPQRRIRLLDAGGCVPSDDPGPRFPHVPSYLPPKVFWAAEKGEPPVASSSTMAAMAGRTLYEVATGKAPKAARYIDVTRVLRAPVSPPVAEVVAALANGNFPNCAAALEALAKRARRRVRNP